MSGSDIFHKTLTSFTYGDIGNKEGNEKHEVS
jgi:hypothetical protein